MRPKKPETTRSGDLFRARLDQIVDVKHELTQLAGQRIGIQTRFGIDPLLLKRI